MSHSHPRSLPTAPPLPWEPALTELRTLSPHDLDQMVAHWLTTLGLTPPRVRERRPGLTTYQALLGSTLLATPLQIRVHQRRNQLSVHHVEAFLGHLQRTGAAGGLLITTGGYSREAILVAGSTQLPRVRLITGAQWVAALAASRSGVKQRRLPRWVVDLRRRLGGPCGRAERTVGRSL
jgi:hypothetical protein